MEHEIVDCIPSSVLREYLRVHPLELSVMQEATIAGEYAKRKKIALFRRLAGRTNSEAEKLLLNTAIWELEQNSDIEDGCTVTSLRVKGLKPSRNISGRNMSV